MARVYQTATFGEADIRVALVHSRSEADLLVHRVNSYGLARGDALWYITRDRQQANVRLYFTSPGAADVQICFVDNYNEAGWQSNRRAKSLPFSGKFSRGF